MLEEESDPSSDVTNTGQDTTSRDLASSDSPDIEIIPSEGIEILSADDALDQPAQITSHSDQITPGTVRTSSQSPDQREGPVGSDIVSNNEELTDHVSNVLDGKQQLEDAKKAVSDLSVICKALRVILVMQCSMLAQFLWQLVIRHTNNEQLRPIRVFVKKQYGVITKHLKPKLKEHGKLLYGGGMVVSTWIVFFVLYKVLFTADYMELSYPGLTVVEQGIVPEMGFISCPIFVCPIQLS